MDTPAYSLLAAGFIALTVISFFILFRIFTAGIAATPWDETRKQGMKTKLLAVFIVWPSILLAVSSTGFFSDFSFFPPRIMLVLFIPLVTVVWFTLSGTAREILMHIPAKDLLRLQVFRVFVELLLWGAFVLNLLPVQMTFEGRNLDILSGIGGVVAALFLANSRIGQYIYNYFGLGLLLNILVIAILSMPTPFRVFMNEPANLLVTQVPFILLPGMLVPLAYGLHFLSLRQLAVLRGK
jgi:hypothetical protein